MSKEALIVLVYFIVDQGLLTYELTSNAVFEPLYDFLQNGLVENQSLAAHDTKDVATCEQFTTFEDDTIGTCVQYVHPQFLIENFSCEDEHFHIFMQLLCLSANFHSHRGGAS